MRYSIRRYALRLAAGAAMAGLVAGCGGPASDSGDTDVLSGRSVAIGLLLPTAGPLKPVGEEMRRGFQLYLDQHGGALGGHRVRLETAAEGPDGESAREGLSTLLGKDVVAVVGVAAPEALTALRDPIRAARVPLLGTNGSPASLQGEYFIWRTSYVGTDASQAMARYMAENVSGRTVMVVPQLPAGQDVLDGYRDAYGADGRLDRDPVLAPSGDSAGGRDFDAVLGELRRRRPAAVFCGLQGAAGAAFVKAYRAAGVEADLYGTGFLTEGTGLAESPAGDGVSTALNYSADLPHAANRLFATAYRKAHAVSPTTYAMASYDAAAVLDKAILLAADDLDAQKLNLMLGKVGQVDSPRGVWQFNQSRTPQQKWYLREVRADGQVTRNVVVRELATLG